MKIFLITHDKSGYDIYSGHVVVANSESEVRDIAKEIAADEGKETWDAATVTIQGDYTGSSTCPFVLLSDFNAG